MSFGKAREFDAADSQAAPSGSVRDALLCLLISTYPDLKKRLTRRLRSAEAADEALQDTYVRLRRVEIQADVRNPTAYLVSMAMNIASNNRRSEARHLSSADVAELLQVADDGPDPLRVAEARSELAAVERALEKLPPRRRAMFRRFWVDNSDYKSIAVEFGVAERTVRHELLLATRYLHGVTEKFFVSDLQKRLVEMSP